MFLKKTSLLLVGVVALLSACSGESVEEQIHTHLEETVTLEEGFKSQQGEITDLEKQEQEIYSQIIDLGMDDLDEITKLSQDALTIIDERKEELIIEKESIASAQEEFQSIEELIEGIEEEALKSKGKEMYETMMSRYAAYEELYAAYMDSLEFEKELYTMLQDEELEQEALNEHIAKINESYETILAANDQFNKHTIAYNELKKEFYEAADMNVSFEEEA